MFNGNKIVLHGLAICGWLESLFAIFMVVSLVAAGSEVVTACRL